MPLVSLGDLFTIALLGTLFSGFLSLATGRMKAHNALVQTVLILSSAVGFVACIMFLSGVYLGAAKAIALPVGLIVIPLSAFFLSIVYLGVFLTSIYAIRYLPKYAHAYSLPWLNLASTLFITGMQTTLFAPSVFWFLIGWEIMSVSAYFLVIADRSDESLYAGFLYFVMTQIGFACIMAGFLIMAHGNPFLDWQSLAKAATALSGTGSALAFLFLFVGFGSKAGLVPLHNWLPYAHPQAPSHSSALLSGVMLKVALYGFLLSLTLLPSLPLWCALFVFVVGLFSAFFGGLFAVVEHDAKRMLAWSSIENMGLLFSGVGAFLTLDTLPPSQIVTALSSGLVLFIALHTINHFLFKSGLFMAAGAAISETHTRDIDDLGGLAQKWPLFSGIFLGLTLAAAALPPLGTFFGEWAYVQTLAAGIASLPVIYAIGAALALSVVALVSGLAIFAFVKLFSAMFLGRARTAHAEHVGKISPWLSVPPLLCVVLSLCTGFFGPTLLVHSLSGSTKLAFTAAVVIVPQAALNPWSVATLALFAALIAAIVHGFISTNRVRVTETWDCGQPLTPRMEYTATGFSSPIRFFFRSLLLSRKELYLEPISPGNPWITRKRMEWGVSSIWEQVLYQPVAVAVVYLATRIKMLQSGAIQLYLLFVLVALAAAFIVAL